MKPEFLILMIKGCEPSYAAMEQPPVATCGSYNGSYGTWEWDTEKLKTKTPKQLEIILNSLGVTL